MYITLLKCIFALVITSSCYSHDVEEHPARVLIREDRSAEDSFIIDIESNGEIKKLNMRPMENIWVDGARIYTLKLDNNGQQYAESADFSEEVKVYHDPETGAVLSIKDGNIDGIVDPEYTIKSEEGNHYLLRRPEENENEYDALQIPENIPSPLTIQKYGSDGNIEDYDLEIEEISKQAIAYYTAEVVVYVDSTLAVKIGSTEKINTYMSIFWNAVNARYKTITTIKIVVKLVAVVVTTNTTAPYITGNIISGNKIKGYNTLYNFSDYVGANLATISAHDMVYLQMGRDMVDNSNSSGLAGLCWLKAICLKSSPRSYATGIGEDMEACYKGVNTAAHELAHNLGADHDGQASSGTAGCPWGIGNIMSYLNVNESKLFFSSCSVANMTAYLTSSGAACTTTNITNPGNFSTTFLPGTNLTMSQQCQCFTGIGNATVAPNITPEDKLCYNLICQYQLGQLIYTYTSNSPAGEGSKCPSGTKKCVNGKCV